MGQKVNPLIFRLGPQYTWSSLWFENKKRYKDLVLEDFKLRKSLTERLRMAGISQIEIERSINSMRITVHVSRPGLVIGRAGTGIEELDRFIRRQLGITTKRNDKNGRKVDIRVEHIKEPNLDSMLVAKNVAEQLLRRLPFKRVLNHTAEKVMGSGAKGVRILLSGRVAGSEIGRREKIQRGTVPLSTIREDVQYSSFPALTKKGYIGIKVWINRTKES